MRSVRFISGVVVVCFILLATPVWSYDQPSVNLGFTSFLDGGPPAGPGLYFSEYLQYYTTDKFTDLPLADAEVEALVSLNQILYQSDTPIFMGASGDWI